jgi:hypothetical protein
MTDWFAHSFEMVRRRWPRDAWTTDRIGICLRPLGEAAPPFWH